MAGFPQGCYSLGPRNAHHPGLLELMPPLSAPTLLHPPPSLLAQLPPGPPLRVSVEQSSLRNEGVQSIKDERDMIEVQVKVHKVLGYR